MLNDEYLSEINKYLINKGWFYKTCVKCNKSFYTKNNKIIFCHSETCSDDLFFKDLSKPKKKLNLVFIYDKLKNFL